MDLSCVHHARSKAKARCVECGDHLCVDCRTKVSGRNYCRPCIPQELKKKVPGRRSPVVATLLSTIPGLGQLYAGQGWRGIVFFASAVAMAAHEQVVPDPVPLFLWVFNLFDAHSLATERNQKLMGQSLDRSDVLQRRFFGLFAALVAGFSAARTTFLPELNTDLLWPIALGLYGIFLLLDRRSSDKKEVNHVQPA